MRKLGLREAKWPAPGHTAQNDEIYIQAWKPRFPAGWEPISFSASCQDLQTFGTCCLFVSLHSSISSLSLVSCNFTSAPRRVSHTYHEACIVITHFLFSSLGKRHWASQSCCQPRASPALTRKVSAAQWSSSSWREAYVTWPPGPSAITLIKVCRQRVWR